MSVKSIKEAITALNISPDDYIVIGSGILDILGIRKTNDVDVVVSEPVFRAFRKQPDWVYRSNELGESLVSDVYEMWLSWGREDTKANLAELKRDEWVIDQIPFISLERLRTWKIKKNRHKDREDVRLIDRFLTTNQ